MVRTRFIAIVAMLAVAITAGITHQASASIGTQCRFDLVKDRFDAVDAVISASHFFIRDVTGFTDVDADSVSEINSDYRQSLRDLASDLRFGLSDIRDARGQALSDISASCHNLSAARVQRELSFYSHMSYRLKVLHHQARVALHKAYVAELSLF